MAKTPIRTPHAWTEHFLGKCPICNRTAAKHDDAVCDAAAATADARDLIDKGALVAGFQQTLADYLGFSETSLSRARSANEINEPYWGKLLEYLRDPDHPPKPAPRHEGRRSSESPPELVYLQGPEELLQAFDDLAVEMGGLK